MIEPRCDHDEIMVLDVRVHGIRSWRVRRSKSTSKVLNMANLICGKCLGYIGISPFTVSSGFPPIPMLVTTLLYSAVVLSIRRSAGHTTVKLRGRVGGSVCAGSRACKRPQTWAFCREVHLSAVSDDHPTSG